MTATGDRVIPCGHTGTGGQKGWVVSAGGIASCLPATQYKDPLKVVVHEADN